MVYGDLVGDCGIMIPIGIGIDLVEVMRVREMLDRFGERVLQRLLTSGERQYCESQAAVAQHVAARVAAKEAAFKALAASGDGSYIGWLEFEVAREIDGRPAIVFHGRALDLAMRLQVAMVHVSLTHTERYAAAIVAVYRG
jgi:holo-[acyl-carrier protein] synthase